MADEQKQLSPLEEANQREREIILGARDDPEHTKLADGKSVIEAREELMDTQTKEGIESLKVYRERVREQSMAGDPIYQGKIQPQEGAPQSFTIIPDSADQQQERFQASQKRSVIVGEKETKTPTPPSGPATQPPVATTPPEKIENPA